MQQIPIKSDSVQHFAQEPTYTPASHVGSGRPSVASFPNYAAWKYNQTC